MLIFLKYPQCVDHVYHGGGTQPVYRLCIYLNDPVCVHTRVMCVCVHFYVCLCVCVHEHDVCLCVHACVYVWVDWWVCRIRMQGAQPRKFQQLQRRLRDHRTHIFQLIFHPWLTICISQTVFASRVISLSSFQNKFLFIHCEIMNATISG